MGKCPRPLLLPAGNLSGGVERACGRERVFARRRAFSMSRLLQHDRRLLARHPSLVGVDEAGRGCLAGPVSAGAVWIDKVFFASRVRCALAGVVNDSKQLSAGAREEIHALLGVWVEAGVARAAQATASVLEIDAYNILGATRLAMQRCLQALSEGAGGGVFLAATAGVDTPLFCDDEAGWPLVLVDGRALKPFAWRHRALTGGDGRSFAIALASVLAKVRRDRLMRELDARHPQYGFAQHKGYGTVAHVEAIRRHGPCAEHRPLFLRSVLGGAGGGSGAHPEFAF